MADTFKVVTQYPTLEFLGGTQTQDVMAIGYRTVRHGVYFEVRIPKKGYTTDNVHSEGLGYTSLIEGLFFNDNVIGVEWTQSPTNSGQLVDQYVVTAQSDSGNSTAQHTFTNAQLAPSIYEPVINALVNTLNNSEGL
jgi:hypothetical protein